MDSTRTYEAAHVHGSRGTDEPARAAPVDENPELVVEQVITKALVIIPTYEERTNIASLVSAVLRSHRGLDVLVIDDASPDGTGEIADAIAASDPRVQVLHRPAKQGLGTAYRDGFRHALSRGYEFVIEMDADHSHRPEDIPLLLAAMQDADVVIGSRNVPGGRVIGWSPLRHVVSRFGSLYARTLLGLPIRDCTAGFKCLRRSALEALAASPPQSRGYAFQVEANFVCAQAGLRVREIPVVFPDRTAGTSKMSAAIALEAGLLVLRLAGRRFSAATRSGFSTCRATAQALGGEGAVTYTGSSERRRQ